MLDFAKTVLSTIAVILAYMLFIFTASGCTQKYIAQEYPHQHALGFRHDEIPLKYENAETLADFIGEFCNRYSKLREKENVSPHECVRKSEVLKFKFYDGKFHPDRAYHNFERDGVYPMRIYEGIYQTTGFVSVNAKGVNFGDTALAHELVHAYDHIFKIHRACIKHEAWCGWGSATWSMIDELDHFAGRGNHFWHGREIVK